MRRRNARRGGAADATGRPSLVELSKSRQRAPQRAPRPPRAARARRWRETRLPGGARGRRTHRARRAARCRAVRIAFGSHEAIDSRRPASSSSASSALASSCAAGAGSSARSGDAGASCSMCDSGETARAPSRHGSFFLRPQHTPLRARRGWRLRSARGRPRRRGAAAASAALARAPRWALVTLRARQRRPLPPPRSPRRASASHARTHQALHSVGAHGGPTRLRQGATSAGVIFRKNRAPRRPMPRRRRGAPLRGHLAAAVVAGPAALHFLGPRARLGVVHGQWWRRLPALRSQSLGEARRGRRSHRAVAGDARGECTARGGRAQAASTLAGASRRPILGRLDNCLVIIGRSTRRAPGSRAHCPRSRSSVCTAGRDWSKATPARPAAALRDLQYRARALALPWRVALHARAPRACARRRSCC